MRARYLVDTSVMARLVKPQVVAAFTPLAATGGVALCAPVIFELGYAARNKTDYDLLMDRLTAFTTVPTTEADHRRSLEVQEAFVESGRHRMLSLVDALVAAVAEARQLTVLHYDSDFESVSALTGQPHCWIVPRGSAE